MKSVSKILALTLLMFSTNCALSAETMNFAAKTTRDLVSLCSAPESNKLHGTAMGYCLGFVDAATDYHAVITSGELLEPIACPDRKVTRGEAVEVFLAWAKMNEALLDTESPIHGLMRAASEKWPCD